jgi:hypothetical protein
MLDDGSPMFIDRDGRRHPILVSFGAKLGHEHAGNRAKAPKDRTDDQKNDADDPQVGNAQSVAQDNQDGSQDYHDVLDDP